MNINTETITTMTEANQNFSKVAKVAENNGQAVIFKNNKPKFLLIDVDSNSYFDITDDEKIDVDVAIENVNLAWKKAKRNRSTKVVVFEEKFRKERGEEQQVVGEFYESLYKGDFLPYFQPYYE